MNKTRTAVLTAEFDAPPEAVWDVMTDNRDYAWRSDLQRIEILCEDKVFCEYTKGGQKTEFFITEKKRCERYAFHMENKMFKGEWKGEFSPRGKGCKVVLTETIHIKNPVIYLLSFLMMNLKKVQKTYVSDLKKKLAEDKAGR